jgi:translation initiation factor 3 subunit B
MSNFDLNNLPEREEDINFDDIYARHQVPLEIDFDTVVIVDGTPIVTDEKKDKLVSVITKLFTKHAGEIKEIWMPPKSSG